MEWNRERALLLLIVLAVINLLIQSFWSDPSNPTQQNPAALQGDILRKNFQNASPIRSSSLRNSNTVSMKNRFSLQNDESKDTPTKARLEFVHIPKTAGSAIESAAQEQGINWGYWHFSEETKGGKRKNLDETIAFRKHYGPFAWHIPPCLLEGQSILSVNPYKGNDLFAVVRNPYERIFSEYRYFKLMLHKSKGGAKNMNGFISDKLEKTNLALLARNANVTDSCDLEGLAPVYFQKYGHWIPQYDYVFRTNFEKNQTTRMIKHVIKYETLHSEFPKLMKQYGLEHVKLPASKEHRTFQNTEDQEHVTIEDISPENVHEINRLYHQDFVAFGYEMKHPD